MSLSRTSPFPPDTSTLPTSSALWVRIRSQVKAPLIAFSSFWKRKSGQECNPLQCLWQNRASNGCAHEPSLHLAPMLDSEFSRQGKYHKTVSQTSSQDIPQQHHLIILSSHLCSPWYYHQAFMTSNQATSCSKLSNASPLHLKPISTCYRGLS